LLGDAELPAGVEHGQAFAAVELNRSQMLNNLFGRIPFLGHDPDLPGCGPVSHSSWTKFARAGQTAVRNPERAGVPRSVAMKLTGHKTEAIYRRYAIVCEADLSEGLRKLAVLEDSLRGKLQPCGTPTDFSHSSGSKSSNYHS